MKKLFKPFVKMASGYYEGTTLTKVPRSKSRKIRRYANVDIQKDFERKNEKYIDYKKKLLEDVYFKEKQLDEPQKQAILRELDANHKSDLIEIGEVDDLKSLYLLNGARKMVVLGVIKYHQLNHNLFEDSRLHPESQRMLEELHYKVEHNLPVEKELLFTMVPEVFRLEINKLQYQDRLQFKSKQKGYIRADGTPLELDAQENRKLFPDNPDDLQSKVMAMEHYLFEQTLDVYNTYQEKISDYLQRNNYRSDRDYYQQLKVMDEENMLPWEREFMKEVRELQSINEDVKALHVQAKVIDLSKIEIPPFIRSEEMRKHFVEHLEYVYKYRTLDIRDTIFIPHPPNEGPSFEERLRLATGGKIEDFIEHDQVEFKRLADARVPIQSQDINEKDNNLIKKMNILAQAVVVEQPPTLGQTGEDTYNQLNEGVYGILSQDHRILIDEIYKVLVLNNKDPQTYNVKFWARHFKIDPAAIRNMFNYLAYPVLDPVTRTVKEVLFFIDVEFLKHKHLLQDVTREDYIFYLEEDYYRRLEKDQEEMQEALSDSRSMRQLILDQPITSSPLEIDEPVREDILSPIKKITNVLEDDSIMEDLDKEIEKYKTQHENEDSQKKNQKSF